MNGASSRRLDDGLGFLYRGELLLRRKEIAGFSGSGKTISDCATRRDGR